MKTKKQIVLLLIAAFDYLFYSQRPGVNFLLFTLLLILMSLYHKPGLRKSVKWNFVSLAAVTTGLCIGYYGDAASVFANVVSLCILSSFLTEKNASAGVALTGAAFSYICSPYYVLRDFFRQIHKQQTSKNKQGYVKTGLTVLVIIISTVFFFMYRSSSMMFYSFTQKINLNFISFLWIFFTLNGLLLISAFFNFKPIAFVHRLFDKPGRQIILTEENPEIPSAASSGDKLEMYAGTLLLILLNALLLIVNVLDFGFFINRRLPEGVTYTEYVHQGVGTLIFSILLAIGIILFFFRGKLNFCENNKRLKILAYAWILQNVLMIFSTVFRNTMYVDASGLTEKRIGVYIYLFLTVTGLLTTVFKIRNRYTNAWLLRFNTWIFYAVLVFACIIDWDYIIVRTNLKRDDVMDNLNYMTGLSDSAIPLLLIFSRDNDLIRKDSSYSQLNSFSLNLRVINFLEAKSENEDWQSFQIRERMVYNKIRNMHLKKINLENYCVHNVNLLCQFDNLEELTMQHCSLCGTNNIKSLSHLKKLVLNNCGITDIWFVTSLKDLQYLDISKNSIINYAPLYLLSKLKVLILDRTDEKFLEYLRIALPNTQITVR